jgi:hypothetical protein
MFPCGIIRYDKISNIWFNITSLQNNCKDNWRSHKHILWVYRWDRMLWMWTSFTEFLTLWLTSVAMQLVVDLWTIPWFLIFYYIFPNSPTFFRMEESRENIMWIMELMKFLMWWWWWIVEVLNAKTFIVWQKNWGAIWSFINFEGKSFIESSMKNVIEFRWFQLFLGLHNSINFMSNMHWLSMPYHKIENICVVFVGKQTFWQ